jgi:hypothetical protein
MRQVIAGIVLIALSIFLAYLSAAVGDAKSLSRDLFLRIEPEWRLATLAIGCFFLGLVSIVYSRKSTNLPTEHKQSDAPTD